jgi:hypothetical protein
LPLLLLSLLLGLIEPSGAEKPVLAVLPSAAEVADGASTNLVAYLLDPLSQPSEIDHRQDARSSLLLEAQRAAMLTNGRTGCALVLYGRGDLTMNSGLYRVYLQRWRNTRLLHNAWVTWKMNPDRVVHKEPAPGEDYFWTEEWWRRSLVRQNLVFRRGLFHVVIEAGAASDYLHMIRLATAIDAKIRGHPVPPARPKE